MNTAVTKEMLSANHAFVLTCMDEKGIAEQERKAFMDLMLMELEMSAFDIDDEDVEWTIECFVKKIFLLFSKKPATGLRETMGAIAEREENNGKTWNPVTRTWC